MGLILVVSFSCKNAPREEPQIDEKTNAASKLLLVKSLYEDLEGNPIRLSDFKGKKIVLSFWATWCAPCIREMPSLLRSQEILEKENYVFLLPSDEATAKIIKFKERQQFNLNFIKFNGSLVKQNIHALPTTFIYNEKGKKIEVIVGANEWDSPEMIQKLRNIE